MIVKKLREAIEDVADVMAAAGAKTQVKALQTFMKIFNGQDSQPVTEFLADLHRRLHPPPPVDPYIDRLLAAANDKQEFDTIFEEIKKDKRVRKDEANAIARKYTEGNATWPTKPRAMKEIRDSFIERALDAVRMRQVDKASRF